MQSWTTRDLLFPEEVGQDPEKRPHKSDRETEVHNEALLDPGSAVWGQNVALLLLNSATCCPRSLPGYVPKVPKGMALQNASGGGFRIVAGGTARATVDAFVLAPSTHDWDRGLVMEPSTQRATDRAICARMSECALEHVG
ncbi:hypothetical protein CSUI_003396, partial [Cystoisospora suis]